MLTLARIAGLALLAALAGCTADATQIADLGELPAIGKGDYPIVVELSYAVPPAEGDEPGRGMDVTFATSGRVGITSNQDRARSWERLQVVVESGRYRRKSWRGRRPHLTVPADRIGPAEYELHMLNYGDEWAYGTLKIETEVPVEPGIEVHFNEPDCEDRACDEPAGALRDELVEAIQSARESIDVAIYGLDDPAILDALKEAVRGDVAVRVITDETSEDPEDSRSYFPAFFDPDEGLEQCGATVEAVRSYGLMHHKFLIIDGDTPDATVVTGSTNFTVAGLEKNHNHMTFIRGVPGLVDAYQSEMGQLIRHCATERLDSRSCRECSPACTEDHSAEGPFGLSDGQIEVYFSPSDDAMRALRGESRMVRTDAPDPACHGSTDDASCICRKSGGRWLCEYCAEGEDGWGLLEDPQTRILMSMYSATDQCFALGVARAAREGVEVLTVFDFVKSGSAYSRDDFLCAEGVPTYITDWGFGSAQVRNHNKLVVIDDVVFDGSMNLGASGARENNENSLVIRDEATADLFAEYIRSEVALLERRGNAPRPAAECLCSDLVDNDGDGLHDATDPDCDGGRRAGGD